MKDLLRGTSALQIEDGASRRRTYARHSWGNADWGRTYFRLLHVFSVDGRVTDPNAWSFQAAIVDPVDDVSAQLEQYRTGLFPLEQGSEGPFQWGDVHVVTYLPPDAQVFTVAARKAPEVPFTQTASLRIDGQLVGQHHFTDGQWHVLRYDLEARPLFRTIRDRRAALEFLTRAMKRYGRPASIVTDRLPSYRAAMKVIGNEGCQETRRWLNNRAENSHQPFRRREGAMARFRDIKTLQTFTSVHASIHNHFNHQRHLNRRDIFKQGRAAALAEWRQLAV